MQVLNIELFDTMVSSLPSSASEHLDMKLDWDNEGVNKDLVEIANQMIHWEEKFSTHLDLTAVEIYDIKEGNHNKPKLQR